MPHKTPDELDNILSAASSVPTKPPVDELDAILSTPSTQKSVEKKLYTPDEQAHLDRAKELEAESGKYKAGEDPGVAKSTMIGVGKGMSDIYRGIGARVGQGLEKVGIMEKGTINDYLRSIKEEAATYAKSASATKHPIASVVGQAVGSAAALPVPPVFGGIAGGSALGAAGRTAANFGLAGAAYGAADVNQADKPMLQAAGEGGLAGAALGGALGGTGKVLMNGIRGATPQSSSILQSLLRPTIKPDEQANLANVAKEMGLKPTFGDISQAPTALSTEQFMTGLPFNKMRSYKLESAEAMEPSIKIFTDKMAGKWADVPDESFRGSLLSMKKAVEKQTTEQYDKALSYIKKEGIQFDNTPVKDYIQSQINEYGRYSHSSGTKKLVNELRNQYSLADTVTPHTWMRDTQHLSKEANRMRILSEKGEISKDLVPILYNIRDKYDDMLAGINGSTEAKAAAQSAREFYKMEMVPFRDGHVEKFMAQEIALDKFLKSMTNTAKAGGELPFLKKLDIDSQQLLRRDFLTFIRNEAIQADGSLDLNKFNSKLNQYSSLKPQLFGDEVKKFEAYAKLLNVMKPQQDLNNMKSMGMGTMGGIGAGIAAVTYPTTAAVVLPAAATLWLYSRMSTNEGGRRILSNLTKITEKTNPQIKQALENKGKALYNSLMKTIPKMYIQGITVNTQQKGK